MKARMLLAAFVFVATPMAAHAFCFFSCSSDTDAAIYDNCLISHGGNIVACDAMMRIMKRQEQLSPEQVASQERLARGEMPADCTTAKTATECAEIYRKLGKNMFEGMAEFTRSKEFHKN